MTPVESVRASSAEAFGFHGNLVEIDLREGPVLLTVHVDEAEHARRTDARLGAITSRQLVTALWELPGGVELSTPDLPTWVRDRLEDIPAAAFDERRDSLVRAARPPLRITGALAIGRRFDRNSPTSGPSIGARPNGRRCPAGGRSGRRRTTRCPALRALVSALCWAASSRP